MKRISRWTALLIAVLLLCSCTKTDLTPTWEGTLPNTETAMTIAGCEASETTAMWHSKDGQDSQELVALMVPGSATVSLQGVEEENLTIVFVTPVEDGYQEYDLSEPIKEVDYCRQESPEEFVQYRFDTAYSFMLAVTTDSGTDRLILDFSREV